MFDTDAELNERVFAANLVLACEATVKRMMLVLQCAESQHAESVVILERARQTHADVRRTNEMLYGALA